MTNAGILLIGPVRTNFSDILIGLQTSLFKKMHLKMSYFCIHISYSQVSSTFFCRSFYPCGLCYYHTLYFGQLEGRFHLKTALPFTVRHQICVVLTHRGRVMNICVGILNIIGSENGLSPGRRQANFWTNAGTLLIEPLITNFSDILIRIQTSLFKKMQLKMSSAKWQTFCLGEMS